MSTGLFADFINRYYTIVVEIGAAFLFMGLMFGIIEMLRKQNKHFRGF